MLVVRWISTTVYCSRIYNVSHRTQSTLYMERWGGGGRTKLWHTLPLPLCNINKKLFETVPLFAGGTSKIKSIQNRAASHKFIATLPAPLVKNLSQVSGSAKSFYFLLCLSLGKSINTQKIILHFGNLRISRSLKFAEVCIECFYQMFPYLTDLNS